MITDYVTLQSPFIHVFERGHEVQNIRFSGITDSKLRKIEAVSLWVNDTQLEKLIYSDFFIFHSMKKRTNIPERFWVPNSDLEWEMSIPFYTLPLITLNDMVIYLKIETEENSEIEIQCDYFPIGQADTHIVS